MAQKPREGLSVGMAAKEGAHAVTGVSMTDQDTDKPTDHDSPWKEALEHYFQEFTLLLFPAIHGEVDWSRGYNPMDKELQQITADANSGRRHADKLIQVYARDGSETWVLIPIPPAGSLWCGCGESGGAGGHPRELSALGLPV